MRACEYARFVAMSTYDADFVTMINGVIQDWTAKPQKPFEVLNAMGAEGWELATVIDEVPPSPDAASGRHLRTYILKRELVTGG